MRPVTDLKRRVAPFTVITDMVPAGAQPGPIAEMERRRGGKDTVLLGATGTGKTAGGWIAERLQRPVLVMLPNKTLAAQFANELREMLPTTPSSTSSRTTTTTSPRRTSRRPTPTSRRTPGSTTRWSGCATRPPTRC